MPGYTKLFSSIITSTIWREPPVVCKVWITMLALADKNGEVTATVPGLADMARVSRCDCEVALKTFLSPDPDSRSKDSDGRRIEEIEGGWELINHAKYRKMTDLEDKKAVNAARQKRYRDRKVRNADSNAPLRSVTKSNDIAEAEAEADTNRQQQQQPAQTAAPAAPALADHDLFIKAWYGLPDPFPKIAAWTKKRAAAFKERMKDPHFRENWPAGIERMRNSAFCQGANERGWRADVDFFLRPDTLVKLLEGKYDKNGRRPVERAPAGLSPERIRMDEAIIAENKKNAERDRLEREREIADTNRLLSQPNRNPVRDEILSRPKISAMPNMSDLVCRLKPVPKI